MPFDPNQPLPLVPVHIPKPWGQEIWHTAVEARGVSQVQIDGVGVNIDVFYQQHPHILGGQPLAKLLLLKILDPKPETILGDLYLEVHERKHEVYVVTAIDTDCYPSQQGAVRLGVNQALRQQLGDAAFRAEFLRRVNAYETVRRQLDAGACDDGLHVLEAELRSAMNECTQLQAVGVGDVVDVAPLQPHSLQHGVRVIEFQNPDYDRHIISFAQEVVTQSHWDSEAAINKMALDPISVAHPTHTSTGLVPIANFENYRVQQLNGGTGTLANYLPAHTPYAVCIAVGNSVSLGNITLQSEQSALLTEQAIHHAQLEWPTDTGCLYVAFPAN